MIGPPVNGGVGVPGMGGMGGVPDITGTEDGPVGSPYRSGRSAHWVKAKNPKAPAVTRDAEEDWGQ